MDVTYKDLLQLIIQREMGIIGVDKTIDVVKKAGLTLNNEGKLTTPNPNKADLERLIQVFHDTYGPVTVMGCKIAVLRLARQGNLELPKLLQ